MRLALTLLRSFERYIPWPTRTQSTRRLARSFASAGRRVSGENWLGGVSERIAGQKWSLTGHIYLYRVRLWDCGFGSLGKRWLC